MNSYKSTLLHLTCFNLALIASLVDVRADELLPPLTLSTTGVVDQPPPGPGCTLPAPDR